MCKPRGCNISISDDKVHVDVFASPLNTCDYQAERLYLTQHRLDIIALMHDTQQTLVDREKGHAQGLCSPVPLIAVACLSASKAANCSDSNMALSARMRGQKCSTPATRHHERPSRTLLQGQAPPMQDAANTLSNRLCSPAVCVRMREPAVRLADAGARKQPCEPGPLPSPCTLSCTTTLAAHPAFGAAQRCGGAAQWDACSAGNSRS